MTEERDASKLVQRAEALVAAASLREPDFEALAARIDASLASAGATDDTLLLPPLPESVEDGKLEVSVPASERTAARRAEPAESSRTPSSERQGASLAELARAAMARRETKDAVSLAKESLAIASQKRASEATSEAVAATAAMPRPRVETAEPSVVTERERRTLPPTKRGRAAAFDTRGPWLGVAIAAVGLAAGFGLYIAGRSRTTIVQVPVAEVAPNAPSTAATATPATSEAKIAAVPAAPAASPESLPAEQSAPAPATAVVAAEALAREPAATKGAATGTLAEARAPSPKGSSAASTAEPKPEKIVLEEEHSGAADQTAKGAAKPGAPAGLKPAELTSSDGIADRPSTGAAQAAVGAVLGAARSCIAGQPTGSSATLIFGSSGEVSSVSVSGPAEGTPAAACIQAALKKARVQPFAAASFSLGVTIRPP